MITGSVALPIWNSKDIAWLCMESLCRQEKPVNEWELIIFEEEHDTQLGEAYFQSYKDRLLSVGCTRLLYLTQSFRLPLSQKWVTIANNTSETSEYFVMCAADNYYHPWMMQDFEKSIKEADWLIQTRGYFFDFGMNKVIHYHYNAVIGLQMAAKTSRVRTFPMDDVRKGVDSWFASNMMYEDGKRILLSVFMDGSEHFEKTLCTNGFNNISLGRHKFFEDIKPPFFETEKKLSDIVPEDIYERITRLQYEEMIRWQQQYSSPEQPGQ